MDPATLSQQITALDQGYNPTDTYNKITTQLGIPDARTRVAALQSNLVDTSNAIKAVDPNVTARTSGALVTEAQRGRLVNMEKAPLTDTYNSENQAFGTQNNQLQDLTSQATQQAGLAQTNYTTKRQSLADQLSTALKQQQDAQAKAESDRQYALQQQAAQQAKINADRSYALQQQQQQQAAAKAAEAAPKAPSQQQVSAAIRNGLNSVRGRDGYVSPNDYAKAYSDWVGAGFNASQFDKAFGDLMNPKNGYYQYAKTQVR